MTDLKGENDMKNLIALTMALLAAAAFADAPEIRNVTAKQRYPWNGKVDISFEIVGDLTNGVPAWNTPVFSLSMTNRADGACWTAAADAVSGDTDTAEGLHHVVWDLDAQDLENAIRERVPEKLQELNKRALAWSRGN